MVVLPFFSPLKIDTGSGGIRFRLRRFFLGFKVRGESNGVSNPLIPNSVSSSVLTINFSGYPLLYFFIYFLFLILYFLSILSKHPRKE